MLTTEVRTPFVWNRPKAKIYNVNQEFGGDHYQPMIDYVETKERQGIFFEKPAEKIHLPEPAELALKQHDSQSQTCGVTELDRALVRGYSQMTKEVNGATAHAHQRLIHSITSLNPLPHGLTNNHQTSFSARILTGSLPNRTQAIYYPMQLSIMRNTAMFPAKQKFYDPELSKEFSRIILFKDPKRNPAVV
eukprot:GFUD01067412.1.p1 GENE.GFUD01067412.1~~GFUD01067412.1.p1  ORF type:complete len:191 (+),score=51.18 GFUD01067412.1:39-611(+)